MINASTLRRAFVSAANNIANHRKQVDALNVFPVPDGDTGINMSMTMGACLGELEVLPETAGAGDVAQTAAQALLWGARGNSGVILSLLFRGFAKVAAGKSELTSADIARGLEAGVDAAYKAVMKPTEGTILTVARESAAKAMTLTAKKPVVEPLELWRAVVVQAKETLDKTPGLLPVLKKAGVVDAGGMGYLHILQGMEAVFAGGEPVKPATEHYAPPGELPDERNAAGEYEGEITFTYCTEFIVIKEKEKADAEALRAYLESIGDSAVVVEDETVIKCHVHTDNPGDALQKALQNGAITKIKIENMREQHAAKRSESARGSSGSFPYRPVDPSQEYGFVAVAAGKGVEALFRDLGVGNVVSGGQTMNPSTDNILAAIHATPAKTVVVLPNNKNIIMAAEQTVKLADRTVYVLPTKTIPQGLAAMLAFDASQNLADNQLAMVKASEKVSTGLITFAARDSGFDGHKIKKGEILAMENGKIAFTEKDAGKAVQRLLKSMLKKDSTFATLLYGEEITAGQAAALEEEIRKKLPETVELMLLNGGQPVYYYMLSVE